MKLKILSLLPSEWNGSADLRAMLLSLIVVGGVFVLKSAYAISEASGFLVLGFLAILVVYWIPPIPKETYLRWIITYSVFLFGFFLFLFPIPAVFSKFVSYRSAQILGVLVYTFCCWLLMRLRRTSS